MVIAVVVVVDDVASVVTVVAADHVMNLVIFAVIGVVALIVVNRLLVAFALAFDEYDHCC